MPDYLLTYDDFTPGRVFALGPRTITAKEIVAFARQFDDQPMHLDAEAGRQSMLGGLAASGWHTAALMMAMIADGFLLRSAAEGAPGVEELSWRRPVLAGDTLAGTATVTGRRPLRSRAGLGLVDFRHVLDNQRGETVLICTHPAFVRIAEGGRT